MGELADAAHEAALMEHITSANIACGGHAGDEATMERTARLALARGVRIGAHPGYPDRANFGRLEMPMSEAEIAETVYRQISGWRPWSARLGGKIVHVKPHGALYNVAARDAAVARAIGRGRGALESRRASCSAWPDRPCSTSGAAWGCAPWPRASPTAATSPTARCAIAKFPDALITDPEAAAAQAVRLARGGPGRNHLRAWRHPRLGGHPARLPGRPGGALKRRRRGRGAISPAGVRIPRVSADPAAAPPA